MVSSYAPYVLCSIFAGALTDRWDKKKTMLACDTLAALSTLAVLILLKGGFLRIWHLYIVNAFSGLMNTVQQPASEVATTAIWHCLMLSMCTENFFLAFGSRLWLWCVGAFLGWIAIPWMSANLDTVNRLHIPAEMQGRVFAARNSFQFFTIPLGYFLGGLLVDRIFEPIMSMQKNGSLLVRLFGSGKGSGAAFLFAVLWLAGIFVCLIFRADRRIWDMEGGIAL